MSTASNNIPLQFLKQKIQDIGSALFFSQNNHFLSMPASIITVLRVDDDGYVWFFVKRPLQCLAPIDKGFPARLDFFRKKMGYFLQVTGRAVIVDEKDIAMHEWADISTEIKNNVLNELTLMKVKMLSVDYFYNSPAEEPYWFSNILHKLQQWAFSNKFGYKPFSLKAKPAQDEQYVWNRA